MTQTVYLHLRIPLIYIYIYIYIYLYILYNGHRSKGITPDVTYLLIVLCVVCCEIVLGTTGSELYNLLFSIAWIAITDHYNDLTGLDNE